MEDYDYVIVGGGTAGCVLAARLSEDPTLRVLLLEAGGEAGGFLIRMPAGSYRLIGSSKDWRYRTEPDPTLCNRSLQWAGGKLLGGSSSINGLVYVRGDRQDYDGWVAAGAEGWSFDDNLPYFQRSENFNGPASPSHGVGGPLQASEGVFHPLGDRVLAACAEIGLPPNPDYCGGDQSGAWRVLSTTGAGQRSSAETAFLAPARRRRNLTVVTGALVDKLLFTDRRATGVRALIAGRAVDYRARREVIVSAGAIGSPAILMRSGIGPAADIRPLGIDMLLDLPGVGRNLQDHVGVHISKLVDVPTYNSPFGPLTIARNLLTYLTRRRGPMTTALVHVMAYARSKPELAAPDVALNFLPMAIDLSSGTARMHPQPGVSVVAQAIRPGSRGWLTLRSADPHDPPKIEQRLLADPADLESLLFGARLATRLFAAPALHRHIVADNMPSPMPASDEAWRDHILRTAKHGYHATGSCAMGGGDHAVVDPDLKVRGTDGLRVIDASVMPRIVSANTNAATIMIAERGADKILGRS